MDDYIKNHMRVKTESDNTLALSLDHSFKEVGEIAADTVNSIEEGLKRLTWRTSYFFDGYQDVNVRINSEDYRFYLSLKQIAKNNSVIALMIKIYLEILLENRNYKTLNEIAKNYLIYHQGYQAYN